VIARQAWHRAAGAASRAADTSPRRKVRGTCAHVRQMIRKLASGDAGLSAGGEAGRMQAGDGDG